MSYREFLHDERRATEQQSWAVGEKSTLVGKLSRQYPSVPAPPATRYRDWTLADITFYFETGGRPPELDDDDDDPAAEDVSDAPGDDDAVTRQPRSPARVQRRYSPPVTPSRGSEDDLRDKCRRLEAEVGQLKAAQEVWDGQWKDYEHRMDRAEQQARAAKATIERERSRTRADRERGAARDPNRAAPSRWSAQRVMCP